MVPLASLALIAFEARRAAMRVVRWLDDGEDFERETPVWRAALAFAAFQAAQMLVSQLVSLWTDDPGTFLGVSYTVSAVLLAALTYYGRRGATPVWATRSHLKSLGLGLLGGLATSAFGRLVATWVLADAVRPERDLVSSPTGRIAFAIAVGMLAPLVEELFFRGWLQDVLARELPRGRKWLAPIVSALAFASVHPAQSFAAVFALGLVAGVLYARTGELGPSVAAHAAHNWGVLLLP
jgi:membrane protease YdiL (CAAX protease family)